MAEWLDYQTAALGLIFLVGFGIVWYVLNLRGGASQDDAPSGSWSDILGVRPDAPFGEIDRAYQAARARAETKAQRDALDWAMSMARRRHGMS